MRPGFWLVDLTIGMLKWQSESPIDVEIENKTDLTEEMVIAKLRSAGGAHQVRNDA